MTCNRCQTWPALEHLSISVFLEGPLSHPDLSSITFSNAWVSSAEGEEPNRHAQVGEASVSESQSEEESPAPSLMPPRLDAMTTATRYYASAQKPKPVTASLHQPDHALPFTLHIPPATPWLHGHLAQNSQPIPPFLILLLPSTPSSWQTKHLRVGGMQPPVPGEGRKRAICFAVARKGFPAAPCAQLWRVTEMHRDFVRAVKNRGRQVLNLPSSLAKGCV